MIPGDLIPSHGIFNTLQMEVVRNLEPAEILNVANTRDEHAPMIYSPQKMRAVHHRQARLLASGKSIREVAAITGTTEARIGQLQTVEAFKDLITYYADQIMVVELDDAKRIQAKLIDAGEQALDEIIERLDDDSKRKAIPIAELRKIVETGVDRTVAPPKAAPSTVINVPEKITISVGTRQIESKATPEPPAPNPAPIIDITPDKEEQNT